MSLSIGFSDLRPAAARASTSAIALLFLTAIHHVYGACIYATPWRLRVLYAAVPSVLFILGTLTLLNRMESVGMRRLTAGALSLVILAFPVATIGMFEGGYNHVVKNLIFFGSGEKEAINLFPPPAYRLPDDLLFEITGSAQFPLGILTGYLTVSFARKAAR